MNVYAGCRRVKGLALDMSDNPACAFRTNGWRYMPALVEIQLRMGPMVAVDHAYGQHPLIYPPA